jgi:hypothetical protein
LEEIILKYQNKNYRFTLSTYSSYFLKDRVDNKNIHLRDVLELLKHSFTMDETELMNIFGKWTNQQETLINNRIVEIKERLYAMGVTVELTVDQMNTIIEDEDKRINGQQRIYL